MYRRMGTHESSARLSLAAALRHVFTQISRTLEEDDPAALLEKGGALASALEGWRKSVAMQTSGADIKRARQLEQEKLQLMGNVAEQKKELDDLRERNQDLRDQLVKVRKRQDEAKQDTLKAKFESSGHRDQVKKLDLEVRELRRRVRELEGGPPLSASEAAPTSLERKSPKKESAPNEKPTASNEMGAPNSRPPLQGGLRSPAHRGPSPHAKPRGLAEAISVGRHAPPSSARAAAEAAFQSMWKSDGGPTHADPRSHDPFSPAAATQPQSTEANDSSSTRRGRRRIVGVGCTTCFQLDGSEHRCECNGNQTANGIEVTKEARSAIVPRN